MWRSEESGPQSSHSAMWVPEIKPTFLGLTTSAFTSEAAHLSSKSYLLTKCDMEPTNWGSVFCLLLNKNQLGSHRGKQSLISQDWRQVDSHKFQVTMVYTVNYCHPGLHLSQTQIKTQKQRITRGDQAWWCTHVNPAFGMLSKKKAYSRIQSISYTEREPVPQK